MVSNFIIKDIHGVEYIRLKEYNRDNRFVNFEKRRKYYGNDYMPKLWGTDFE